MSKEYTPYERFSLKNHPEFSEKWVQDLIAHNVQLDRLITMLDDVKAQGVKCHSLTEAIDITTPTSRPHNTMLLEDSPWPR